MTYQVLARKYRPQTFAEVVGQEHITTTLKNALASKRIHHAYLFTGVRGVGKTTIARILAKALNCQQPKDCEPCNACPSCTEIREGRSMDVQEIDGASNTGVDDVREIRERVKYMPSSGRYKVYIIDEVHMLSTAAFNALLKTLEEPPAHVIFMFATTEAHKIPATILSRCQRYDFRRIPSRLIARSLTRIAASEGVSIDEDSVHAIAREATGSLRDAQSLFDQTIAYAAGGITTETINTMLGCLDRSRLFALLHAIMRKDAKDALTTLDEVFLTGADLARFACDLLETLRHLLVLAECGPEPAGLDLPSEEIVLLQEAAQKLPAPELHQMFSAWYGVADAVSRSAFPKMLLEVGLIRLCRIADLKPLGEILSRLDALAGEQAPLPRPSTQDGPTLKTAPPRSPAASKPLNRAPEKQPASPAGKAPAAPPPKSHDSNAEGSALTFEPGAPSPDAKAEERWQAFMRWVIVERPQAAAILEQGTLEALESGTVRMRFSNAHYAEMLLEEDRLRKAEELLATFFKKPMSLRVHTEGAAPEETARSQSHQKKEIVRKALDSEIVRQAAEILGAELHDVKVGKS